MSGGELGEIGDDVKGRRVDRTVSDVNEWRRELGEIGDDVKGKRWREQRVM